MNTDPVSEWGILWRVERKRPALAAKEIYGRFDARHGIRGTVG